MAVALSIAVFMPGDVGANPIVIMHEAAGASASVHPSVTILRSGVPAPASVTVGTPAGTVPLLVTVRVVVGLTVPISTMPKS
jgi:hypothetical protein